MKPIFVTADARTRRQLLASRQEAQTDKSPRVALRLQAILLSADGHTPPAIVDLLHVHRSRVHDWIRRWMDHGIEGVKEGHRSGRPSELTPVQQQALHDIIESEAIFVRALTQGPAAKFRSKWVLQEGSGHRKWPRAGRKLTVKSNRMIWRSDTRLSLDVNWPPGV